MEIKQAKCPVCGGEVHGRTDKRFCSDKCRSLSNAGKRNDRDAVFNQMILTIRRNRSLLRKLCKGNRVIVRREVLDALDFDATAFTSIHVNSKKQTYYFNGEYGILPIFRDGAACALIVHRESFATPYDPWDESANTSIQGAT
ncbi:MAG: hypothetical protein JST46_13875 [Bacteroidetes bacterium]|nr:hypothetical protein [Bacteroidota bacterium]